MTKNPIPREFYFWNGGEGGEADRGQNSKVEGGSKEADFHNESKTRKLFLYVGCGRGQGDTAQRVER